MQNRVYANKQSNVGKLTDELITAGLVFNSRFFGVTYITDSNTTIVYVADDFTANEGIVCDDTVAAHVPQTLAEAKAAKNGLIDTRTQDIIAQGAPYDGHYFSMGYGDQLSYIALDLACVQGQAVFPIEVRDMVDAPYYLADAAAYYTFFFTGLGYVQAVLAGGRAIKDQVNACTTIEQVNAIVDPR